MSRKLALACVTLALSTAVALFPTSGALGQGLGQAKLKCNGTATFSAKVTWWWTLNGQPITAPFTLSCTGTTSAGPVASGRPRQANDYHRELTVSDTAKGTSKTCKRDAAVAPGFGFTDSKGCKVDPPAVIEKGKFTLSAP